MLFIFVNTAPSQPPQQIRVSNIGPKYATVNWEPPEQQHRNGIITSYRINLNNIISISDIYTTSRFYMTLRPYHRYSVSIAAVTIAIGPYSSSHSFQTHEAGMSWKLELKGVEMNILRGAIIFSSYV